MKKQKHDTTQVAMTGPRLFVFSLMMQKVQQGRCELSPLLITISTAEIYDEALGLAMREAKRRLPAFTCIDWASCEILAPTL